MSLIEVNNVSKSYKSYGSELKRIINFLLPIFKTRSETVVLNDISFKVDVGEAIGLVGVNGAGKSTLLKIITGTLQPTSGFIKCSGRISAILELGMGFNPNLTGRQNAIHSAGLMGYNLKDINKIIHEIEDFAEIGEYFDKPVRVYSSGMQVRVAFAVATAFRPDVLIIDEAFSVGDIYFQHKSFERIKQFQGQGTTLFLVSHDKNAILALCKRVLLLYDGSIVKDGNPQDVVDYYNALIAEKENKVTSQSVRVGGRLVKTSGTGQAQISNIKLLNSKGDSTDTIEVGEIAALIINVEILEDVPTLVLGVAIRNNFGQVIFGTNTWHSEQVQFEVKKLEKYTYCFQFPNLLGVGNYSVSISLSGSDKHLNSNYEWRDFALVFSSINLKKLYFDGAAYLEPEIIIKKVEFNEK